MWVAGQKGLNMTRFVAVVAACVLVATQSSLHAQPQSPPDSGDSAADLARIDRLEAQLAALQAQIDQLRKLLAVQPQPLAAPASGPDIASTPDTPAPASQEARAEAGKPAALSLRIGTVDDRWISRPAALRDEAMMRTLLRRTLALASDNEDSLSGDAAMMGKS